MDSEDEAGAFSSTFVMMAGLSRTQRFPDFNSLPPLPSTPTGGTSPVKAMASSSLSDIMLSEYTASDDGLQHEMSMDIHTIGPTTNPSYSPSKRTESIKIVSPIPHRGSILPSLDRTPSPRGPRTSLGSVDLNDVSYGQEDALGDITIDSIPLSTPLRIGRATLDVPSSTRSSRGQPTPPSSTRSIAKSRSTSGSSLDRIAEDEVASVPFSKRSPVKRMPSRYTSSDSLASLAETSPSKRRSALDRSMSVSELLSAKINRSPVKMQTLTLDRSMSITDLLAQGSGRDRHRDRSLSVDELMSHADPSFLNAVPEPSEIGDVSFTVDEPRPSSPFLPPRSRDLKLALPLPTPSRARKTHRRSLSQGALPESDEFEWVASKRTIEVPISKRPLGRTQEPSPAVSRLVRSDVPPLSPRSKVPRTPVAPVTSRLMRTVAAPTSPRLRVRVPPPAAPASPRVRAPVSSRPPAASIPVPALRAPRMSTAPPGASRARPLPAINSQGLPSVRAASSRPVSVPTQRLAPSRVANVDSRGLPAATNERPMRSGGSVGRFKPCAPASAASAGSGAIVKSSSSNREASHARDLSRLGLPLASVSGGSRVVGSKGSLPARPILGLALGESGSRLNGERDCERERERERDRPRAAKSRIGSTPARMVNVGVRGLSNSAERAGVYAAHA